MNFEQRWDEIVGQVKPTMEAMHQAREVALTKCRQVVQLSSKSIRHIHRRDFEPAEKLLAEATQLAKQARAALSDYPQLLFAGYLQDAEKEMVEASAVFAIVRHGIPAGPSELGVELSAYLNGMGEAASECRRYVLDEMRKGDLDEAERMLAHMETIYDDLITFDYADSLTGGLRRTCDALRGVIERTRSDLTMTRVQRDLMAELRKHGGS